MRKSDKTRDTILTTTHWGTYSVETTNGRLSSVAGWQGDPCPSPIGRSLIGTVDGPLRIRRPTVRRGWLDHGPRRDDHGRGGEPFVEISWARALDLVSKELERIRDQHGNQAIYGGSYGWASAGRFHHAQSQLHRFLNTIGGYTASVQDYSWAAGEIILPHVIGSTDGLTGNHSTWDTIANHSGLVVAFGGLPIRNAQVQAGGLGRHEIKEHLARASQRGVRMVSVSPIRDDAPQGIAAEWLALRPNTDVAVMMGLAHVLIKADLHDRSFLSRYCVGFEQLRAYVLGEVDAIPKTPEWAAAISGLDKECITALAREMAATRTMIMVNWAVQRADHGEQPYWMAIALAALLGQIGLPGGGFGFGYGATNGMGRPELGFKWPALPQGSNPVQRRIPVARISDMLLHPGRTIDFNGKTLEFPDIRLVYWAGGNPFHHHQDINRLVAAWRRPETVIIHEPYWNSLARHADVVLPATTTLERNDIAFANRENVVVAMKQVIDPVGEARSDFAIFSGLADRLGVESAFTAGRCEMTWIQEFYARARASAATCGMMLPSFDDFWRLGHVSVERKVQSHVLLAEFRGDPEAHRLATSSGKIELYSKTIASFDYDDCFGHPAWFEPAEWLGNSKATKYPIHLLSCQPSTKLHSQYDHGLNSIEGKIQSRTPIRLNPLDAEVRDIAPGDIVRVFNDRGACLAGAVLDADILRGVAQMATGAWYDPEQPGALNSLDKHGNPNMLTLDKGSSRLAQAPIPNSTLVEVEPFRKPAPPITVFTPPI
jgi:biotin/methionine sulfoxide reductase